MKGLTSALRVPLSFEGEGDEDEVKSVEAERVVAACRYQPESNRSMTAVRGADFTVITEFKGMTSSSSHFLIFTAEAQSKAIEKHFASQRLCGQFNRTQPVTTQVGRLEIAPTTTQ